MSFSSNEVHQVESDESHDSEYETMLKEIQMAP